MLQYGWRILSSTPRRSLWILALGCALITALPGALAGTVLAGPVVAFLVTGNPLLSLSLLPEAFTGGLGPAAGAWIALAVALLIALCFWSRLYAAAVWGSDQSNEPGLRPALRATRSRWRGVVRLYLESGLLLICVLVPVGSMAIATGGNASGAVAVLVLVVALAIRSLIRVTTTLAIRAAVLDAVSSRAAWRSAIAVLKRRRTDAAAVWVALLAIGAAVWLVGRLISPILQDTAFDYPSGSSYAALREVAQIVFAVPLEAFLLVFSIGAWTAVYREIDARPQPRPDRSQTNPWAARVAASLLGLTIVANGVPTAIDASYSNSQARRITAIGRSEIEPEETLRAAPNTRPSSTTFDVSARLEDDHLSWTTEISYRNETGQALKTLAFHIYPAAYERSLAEIPLASDLLAGDLSGSFRSEAEQGDLTVERILVDGVDADRDLDDTSMVVDLPRLLREGSTIDVTIQLSADLPTWPERFGVWNETTLLGNWVPTVAARSNGRWLLDEFGPVGDPFFSEVADYRVAIEADDRQRVTGSGSLTGIEQTSEDTRTWTFEAPAMRDVAYAASSSLRALQRTVGRVVVRSWYSADSRALGASNLSAAASAVADYSTRFGPLPFDEIDVVATSGLLGGMEYPGAVFIAEGANALEGVPILPELLEFAGFEDAQRRYVIGHEIAHQWWYASVGNDQVREPWLDEALAEVSTISWLRRTEGDDRTWRMTNLLSDPPADDGNLYASVDDFESNQEYTESIYQSGASALLDLRDAVGAQRFDAILRAYHEANRLGIATGEDFLNSVREVAGEAAADSFAR